MRLKKRMPSMHCGSV
jgi:hypothetical protein